MLVGCEGEGRGCVALTHDRDDDVTRMAET